MLKKIAILVIVCGFIIIGYSLTQIHHGKVQVAKALDQAVVKVQPKSQTIAAKADPTKFQPKVGDTIGVLEIPAIKAKIPIIEGSNASELAKGVGHYHTSALPGENNQIVLSGHRDTVFRKFYKLRIGDTFTVKLPYGTFTYKSYKTDIVPKNDTTIIHSTAPKEELVLTTCYPFYYFGNAPKRFIVYAKPVKADYKR